MFKSGREAENTVIFQLNLSSTVGVCLLSVTFTNLFLGSEAEGPGGGMLFLEQGGACPLGSDIFQKDHTTLPSPQPEPWILDPTMTNWWGSWS